MGNREALLAGAKKCLLEKGYARTTVRDISAAAGVSMAAIGYHYGSREALLNAAMFEAMDDWGKQIQQALEGDVRPGATPAEEYQATWTRMIESFTTHRAMWIATFEAFLQAQHSAQLRDQLAVAQREGRRGLAAGLLGVDEERVDDHTVRALGSVQMALLSGLMTQWVSDPETAPTGEDVVAGLRALARFVGPDEP